MYVACTRARDQLHLYVPASMYDKATGGSIPAVPSPFVRELSPDLYTEWQEGYTGALVEKKHRSHEGGSFSPARAFSPPSPHDAGRSGQSRLREEEACEPSPLPQPLPPSVPPSGCGFCTHRIFGRGKIVQHIAPDKVRVNFPGVGLKVIMAAYLSMED